MTKQNFYFSWLNRKELTSKIWQKSAVEKWLKFKCLFRDLKKNHGKLKYIENQTSTSETNLIGSETSGLTHQTVLIKMRQYVNLGDWWRRTNFASTYVDKFLVMKNLIVIDPRVPSTDQNYGFCTCKVSLTITALFSTKISVNWRDFAIFINTGWGELNFVKFPKSLRKM